MERIVAVHHGVDDRLEDRLLAVLRHVDPRRNLAGRDLHVAHGEPYRVRDLPLQRARDFLRVDLPGGAVGAPVAGRRDGRVRQPPLRIPRAEQHAGDGCAPDARLVRREQRELFQRHLRLGCALRAQQRPPERGVQRVEPGLRHRLLVAPEITALRPPLGEAQPFVAGQLALGRADSDEAAPPAFVQAIAPGHLDEQEGPAVHFPMMNADAHRRLDEVGAHLDQQIIQRRHLGEGHPRNLSVVRHAAQQHAAVRVGEGGDLVGQVVAARAAGLVAGEHDLLELPAAVFALPQPLPRSRRR